MRSPRSRFFVACTVGGLLATLVFAWVVLVGSVDLFAKEQLAGFYDVQARSLLHGRWDVPASALSLERFKLDGRSYTYFGPWPAVLRMPIVAFTRDLDGRLSRVSMIAAFVVMLVFVSRIAWQARALVRGDGPPTRATLVAAAGFVFTAGCGSTALFLAGRAWVYHEAILWAIAWSLASFSFLLSYITAPRGRDLTFACLTATLALLSRPSVGAGPVVALGILLAVQIIQRVGTRLRQRHSADAPGPPQDVRLTRWLGVGDAAANRPAWTAAVALAVPVMLYAYVNYSKFGTPFGLPIDKQDILLQRPERRAALAASHSLFSLRYAPTNLLQYLRPDAIGFDRLFPWVTFSARPQIVGDVPFDNIEPSASIPAVSTLLFVLTVVGTVGAIRLPRPDAGRASAAALRVPLLATTLAAAGMFLAAVQFERYEGDAVPVLVIASAAGLSSLPTLLTGRRRNVRTLIAGALVALAAWSCLATFSLALQYQRAFSTFQTTPIRTGFVAFQLDVNDALGLPRPDIQRGSVLPHAAGKEERRTTAPLGTFFVLPYCAGVYLSNGKEWQPVEESLGDVPTPICNRLLGKPR